LTWNGSWYCRAGNKGSILILALWVIFLLALLAVAVGAHIDGRLTAARRMEQRMIGYYAARSGVERSLFILGQDTNRWDAMTEPWADSRKDFSNVVCGTGVYSVFYAYDLAEGGKGTNFGIWDEQCRIDLNKAVEGVLASLLVEPGGMDPETALKVAKAVKIAGAKPAANSVGQQMDNVWIDSRLQSGPFKSIAEVRWVKGMTDETLEKIKDYVTVHGDRRVNLNTAGTVVMRALLKQAGGGKSDGVESLIRKILQFRQSGGIFKAYRGNGLAEALGADARLTAGEQNLINGLDHSSVDVASRHFRGHVEGSPASCVGESRKIDFIWDSNHHKIEFWHEE